MPMVIIDRTGVILMIIGAIFPARSPFLSEI